MASSVAVSLMGSSMASSVPPAVEEVSEEGLPIITLEEVKNHFSLQDAWMVVYDRVYNVTSFLAEVCKILNKNKIHFFKVYFNTGKSLSESLILASTI